MQDKQHNTSYTESVIAIFRATQSLSYAESLYQQARDYFQKSDADKAEITRLSKQISQLAVELNSASTGVQRALMLQLESLEAQLNEENIRLESQRLKRLNSAIQMCHNIVALSEGENYWDTQHKSSKFLGSTLLLSPGHGLKLSELHQSMKPAYKAVLSLRLLDKLLLDDATTNKHILEHYNAQQRYEAGNNFHTAFTQTVILPVMLTAMFQDIGMQHPRLIALLKGEGDKDLFRILEAEERKVMLKLSHKYCLQYLRDGLGCQASIGNTNAQRAEFEQCEKQRIRFQARLLQDAVSSKLGIGDIIKIPQIYTSVVLSTKRNYRRKDLPIAAILIDRMGQNKSISGTTAKAFVKIVGFFPQGYGLSYIPTDLRGIEIDSYEFGIVNGLNPDNPQEPVCRKVTRNMTFITSGDSGVIKKTVNLHYRVARRKIVKIEKARLIQILEKLRYNFDPNDVFDLLPTYWEPYEYFSLKKRQNLWSGSSDH